MLAMSGDESLSPHIHPRASSPAFFTLTSREARSDRKTIKDEGDSVLPDDVRLLILYVRCVAHRAHVRFLFLRSEP